MSTRNTIVNGEIPATLGGSKTWEDEIKELRREKKKLEDETKELEDEKKKAEDEEELEDEEKKKLVDEIKKLKREKKKLEDEKKRLENEKKKPEDEMREDGAGNVTQDAKFDSQSGVKSAGLELLDVLPHSSRTDHENDEISGDFSPKDLKMIYWSMENGIKAIGKAAHREAPSRLFGSAEQKAEYDKFQKEKEQILKSVQDTKELVANIKTIADLEKKLQNLKKDYEGLEDLCSVLSSYRATTYSVAQRQKKDKETKKQLDATGMEIKRIIDPRLFRRPLLG